MISFMERFGIPGSHVMGWDIQDYYERVELPVIAQELALARVQRESSIDEVIEWEGETPLAFELRQFDQTRIRPLQKYKAWLGEKGSPHEKLQIIEKLVKAKLDRINLILSMPKPEDYLMEYIRTHKVVVLKPKRL